MKLALIIGTRPNFVKAAALWSPLREVGCEVVLIHTGQHSDLALNEGFFGGLGLPEPHYNLGIPSGSRGSQFGQIVQRLSQLLGEIEASEVMVVGDVTSTAAGAIAADCLDLRVSHVEAGLRSFDRSMPEERNRRVVDTLAERHFVSEPAGIENLVREGHSPANLHLVGNVMIDTLLRFCDEAIARCPWENFGVPEGGYILATLHRPSNVDCPEALRAALDML